MPPDDTVNLVADVHGAKHQPRCFAAMLELFGAPPLLHDARLQRTLRDSLVEIAR